MKNISLLVVEICSFHKKLFSRYATSVVSHLYIFIILELFIIVKQISEKILKSTNDISYTLSTIGENLEDLAESKYNSQNGKIKELPYPSTIFAFDEQDMEEQLKYYENIENKKQLEDYEYE